MNRPIRLYRIPFDSLAEEIPEPEIVGNKAHNLMRLAGRVPVPPGFVIPVDFCREYRTLKTEILAQLDEAVEEELEYLGHVTGRGFNSKRSPFLVSVRSGAAVSMPGMMETILNIGLNEDTLRGLIRQTGNPKFAWDCLRRFIQQYGEVVYGLSSLPFDKLLEAHLHEGGASAPEELDIDSLKKIASEFNTLFKIKTGRNFPYSPIDQLRSAIDAVMRSWYGKRAAVYRQIHSIQENMGTAVIVQVMVFGNTGRNSGSGVGFTRNPANGDSKPYIDYLCNAQGEDIVSGRRNADQDGNLVSYLPEVHAKLLQFSRLLEEEFRDMQDFEFTVEQGRLYILQSRNGKRTALAALKIAVDLVEEDIINPARALQMLEGYDPARFTRITLSLTENDKPIGTSTGAGTGVAVGAAVFDVNRIDRYIESCKEVILLGKTLSTDDIVVMNKVLGLVTVLGARTSHAAVVARQLGKVCLVGCTSLRINEDLRHCFLGETRVDEGEILSLDGESGKIYQGQLAQVVSCPDDLLAKVSGWRENLQASSRDDY